MSANPSQTAVSSAVPTGIAVSLPTEVTVNSLTETTVSLPTETTVSLPTDKELVLKVISMPGDSNANGDIFGGWVMAQVDLAGSVIPARIAKGRIATVAVNEFLFKQPVKVGDLLSFYAEVIRIGNTSVTVHVEVYAQRLRQADEIVKVTDANLTYVAIDMEGKPRPLPKS